MVVSREIDRWLSEIRDTWADISVSHVDPEKLKHLAIICDGNRRAARERNLPEFLGHRAGLEVIKGVACAGRNWNINTLTFWVWSTENWERDKKQIHFVMQMARKELSKKEFEEELKKHEVKFKHLGRSDRLPKNLKKRLINLEQFSASFQRYHLNLALDYGGADELARAIFRMEERVNDDKFNFSDLRKRPLQILDFLDTAGQPLPDLVIRTGVKNRELPHTSGFMPLQTAYSSWIFMPDLFPNLIPERLLISVQQFLGYERRLGR